MTKTLYFKRFDASVPEPVQATQGAAGIDLYARKDTKILPHQVAMVPLNVALKPPTGHWILLAARSSLHKMGLMLVNGIGVGDEDYVGDDDEYKAALLNFTDKPVIVRKGERIVQVIVTQKVPIELVEVEKMSAPNRGGFGSTGKK
jgi:dUTP pyrophosphatase